MLKNKRVLPWVMFRDMYVKGNLKLDQLIRLHTFAYPAIVCAQIKLQCLQILPVYSGPVPA